MLCSNKKRRAEALLFSFCEICHAALPDHIDLDLSRIFELRLDLLRNIPCEQDHIGVVHLFRNDHDTDLASGLDGKGLLHTIKGGGNPPLKPFAISSSCFRRLV